MKQTLLTSLFSFIVFGMLLLLGKQHSIGNTNGANAGHTGAPADGKTCIQCHNTMAVPLTNLISSNIPTQGYTPGATYTFTAAVGQTGINRYGFQISPQAINGSYLGNIIVTNTAQTKIVGTKYITHTNGGVSGIGFKAWNFDWIAPSAGTGDVTFYGSFVYANGNNASSGDMVRTNTYTVSENVSTSLVENNDEAGFSLYPNPVRGISKVKLSDEMDDSFEIRMFDVMGKILPKKSIQYQVVNPREVSVNFQNITSGIYFIQIRLQGGVISKKIVVL